MLGKQATLRPADEKPRAQDRTALRTRLASKEIPAEELDRIITGDKSRKAMAEDLKAYCRALPRDKAQEGARG